MDILHQPSSILDNFIYSNSKQVNVAHCYYLTQHLPTQTLDWETTYQVDSNMPSIIEIIQAHALTTIPNSSTASIKPTCKSLLIS